MAVPYLFVDGHYLEQHFTKHMQDFYGEVPQFFFEQFRAVLEADRVYYYDAIDYEIGPTETAAERDARVAIREAYLDIVDRVPGFHVRDGRVRRYNRRRGREQKGVDVQLAVDAMEHAARGNMSMAMLLTGDLDFEPLLASLVRFGIKTRLWYIPRHTATELMRASDEIRKITLGHFYDWSALSFQQSHTVPALTYRYNLEVTPILTLVREGTWQERMVRIFQRTQAPLDFILCVDRGDELIEPSYTLQYPDIDKVILAFELTFGPIEWQAVAT
jgi:uncharacterized LabA/DUF88 family protein